MDIKLRLATIDDAQMLYEWRSDPATMAASHTTREFSYESHVSWLTSSLKNPARTLYIASIDEVPVGTVRLDIAAESAELSWTVAPGCRMKGVGTAMVREAAAVADRPLRAEIKSDNVGSIRIAEKNGFERLRESDGVLYFVRHMK